MTRSSSTGLRLVLTPDLGQAAIASHIMRSSSGGSSRADGLEDPETHCIIEVVENRLPSIDSPTATFLSSGLHPHSLNPPAMPSGHGEVAKLTLETLKLWVDDLEIEPPDREDRQNLAMIILSQYTSISKWEDVDRIASDLLQTLPSLDIIYHLDASDLCHLTSLPSGITVNGALNIEGCIGLTSLPSDITVNNSLHFRGCTGLTSLPSDMTINGSLTIEGCIGLTSLPSGMRVGGWLDLSHCTGLMSLPSDMLVCGDLYLNGCTGLTELPLDMTVDGDVNLSYCTNLISIPYTLLSGGPHPDGGLREMNISGTGLHQQVRERLLAQPNPNVRIIYSEEHNDRPSGQSETLEQVLEHFQELDQAQALLTWPAEQQSVLCRYLGRLVVTADHKNTKVRPALLERLNAVLRLAHDDTAFRDHALTVFDEAVASCGDRASLGLNTIELGFTIIQARRGEGAERALVLRQLGISMMRLSIVHRHAAQSCRSMQFVDEVEIYLAYETKLRERLGLPGRTVAMLYSSGVDDEDFKAAAQDAERQSADPVAVEAFLACWAPWQQHLRQTEAEGASFEQVTSRAGLPVAPSAEPRLCAISQEPEGTLVQPVYLGSTAHVRVYEYADLITWWVEHGKEPAPFGVFTLDQLWRASK